MYESLLPLLILLLWSAVSPRALALKGPDLDLKPSGLFRSIAIERRLPGCYFGGKHHKFGAKWSPIMEPMGLMRCVKCECLEVTKKGIVQTLGETVCKNIRKQCPNVTCAKPRTLPGRCCKICGPEDDIESNLTFQPDRPQPLPSNKTPADDTATYHDTTVFSAVLTGAPGPRDSPPGWTAVKTRAVAALRLTVRPGQLLDFTMRWSRVNRPKYLQLVDTQGDVQLQRPLVKGRTGGRKMCGTWTDVPPVYITYLHTGVLHARLTASRHTRGLIAGNITPVKRQSSEIVSTVLTPTMPDGSGGWAAASYSPRSRTVVFTVQTHGLTFSGKKKKFFISLIHKRRTIHRIKKLRLSKGELQGSWRINRKRYSRLLARGRLRMSLSVGGRRRETPLMEGRIATGLSCDVYQALVVGGGPQHSLGGRPPDLVSGIRFTLEDRGSLRYEVDTKVTNHPSDVSIYLEGSRPRHGRQEVSRLKNGLYRKLDLDMLHRLIHNRMYVSMTTGGGLWARGALVSAGGGHVTTAGSTVWVTLPPGFSDDSTTHGDPTEPTNQVSAYMWASADSTTCRLHFGALTRLSGRRAAKVKVRLWHSGSEGKQLESWSKAAKKRSLRGYTYFEGEVVNPPGSLLLALDRGYASVQVLVDLGGHKARSRDVQIRIPNRCWTDTDSFSEHGDTRPDTRRTSLRDQETDGRHAEEDDFNSGDLGLQRDLDLQRDLTATQLGEEGGGGNRRPVCVFEGQSYPEGTAWLPDVDAKCTTCSCVKNKTTCQRMICPSLECAHPVTAPGECCPSCPVQEESTETCQLGPDPRQHRVHTTWHPYLPTGGFTQCAVCTCLRGGRVECSKTSCPALTCDKSRWIKSQTNPCCYVCAPPPPPPQPTANPSLERPQQDIDMKGACVVQGTFRPDGDWWHPTIKPFGLQKCFLCQCKDGGVKCGKLVCPKLKCAKTKRDPGSCCKTCEEDTEGETAKTAANGKANKEVNRNRKHQVLDNKVCFARSKVYTNGARWRPTSSVGDRCTVCRCKEGKTSCKSRCPKVCKTDMKGSPCCKHCRGAQKDVKTRSGDKKTHKRTKKKKKASSVLPGSTDLIRFLRKS